MKSKVYRGLKRTDGTPILDLNASWESAPIPFSEFLHYGIQLGWDNAGATGDIRVQYSCDPSGDGNDVLIWTDKNAVNLDGSFQELMFLDTGLAVGNIRLTFIHTGGAANLDSYAVLK